MTILNLEKRVIIVTGGATGIGKTYSKAFAQAGAKVVIADIASKEAKQVAGEILDRGEVAIAVTTDISDEYLPS